MPSRVGRHSGVFTGSEDLSAARASRSKHLLVTTGAVQLIILEGERLVD